MSLVEMNKDEILSAIEDRRLDEADLLELITDNDFEIALAAARSPDSTGPILDIAAHDRDDRIRLAAVNNNNCGEKTLELLSIDKNAEIAALAKKRIRDRKKPIKAKWYCKECKAFHEADELCPQIRRQLKAHPEWIASAVDFTVVAGEEALITTQALDLVARKINAVAGTNLSYEGTQQFSRDIQVFKRLNEEPFSRSGVFSSPENAKAYYENVLEVAKDKPRSLTSFESKLTGYSEETDWLRQKHGQLSSLWKKSELLSDNAPGVDGITYNRFTGKQISRTTIKASSNPMTRNSTGISDVKKAIEKGYATPEDIIYGPEGTRIAASDAGLTNPVEEKNSVQAIRDSIKRQEKKIANGEAYTKPGTSQIAGHAFQGAIVSGAISLSLSALTTYVRYKNGEISREQAFKDISENSLKGALVGGTLGGVTIFLPGGVIGFVAGNAIGIYVNASLGNILDEIYGKGAFESILDSSGYVCGMTYSLEYCLIEIKRNSDATDQNIKKASDIQADIEALLRDLES